MIPIEEFQRLARDFLDGHAARRPPRATGWGEGSDDVGVIREAPAAEDRAALVTARWWRAEVFDGGFGWINGPRRYGGMELSNQHVRAWARLEAEYETPSQHHLGVGLGMVGPTILDCGTQVQRDRYLRAIHRGDLIACQLFSEPGAGSDLASIDTRAEQVGGAWVINGHKVWTSSAHVSDIGEIICRTDPSAAKHDGLTAFLVDMRTPGVEVRPIRQMTGGSSFNEVFLHNVRIGDDDRLGAVDQGWRVAVTTLLHERVSVGSGGQGGGTTGANVERLTELARQFSCQQDPHTRQLLVDIYINGAVARLNAQRAASRLASGGTPGPESSLGKLSLTQNLQRISALLSHVLGPRLVADTGEWGTYAWSKLVLGSPGIRIGGGTDEIQKNILAERVLGLPRDAR